MAAGPGFDEEDVINSVDRLHEIGEREITAEMILESLKPGFRATAGRADVDLAYRFISKRALPFELEGRRPTHVALTLLK